MISPSQNSIANQLKSLTATASLSDLVMPPVASPSEAIGFVQDFIRGQNSQAGALADMLPSASPMATNALIPRIGQLAGRVGPLALAFGALYNLIDQERAIG